MLGLPRIALGTVQKQSDATAVLWALMDTLERSGLRVQSFLSQAYFARRDGATPITGLSPRHLDSWLMNQEQCRAIFTRGAQASDLALVEGAFATPPAAEAVGGASLDTLCRWLDLPRIGVVDARQLGDCCLPPRCTGLDGIILDYVSDLAQLCRLETLFQSLWNTPVVGCLGPVPGLRQLLETIPPGQQPPLGLCHALGDAFYAHRRLEQIYQSAGRRPLPGGNAATVKRRCPQQVLHVAVAYDEAFYCYFPDTLDLLESQGAVIHDFSPLRDERLPPETDIVYLGCGHPELFADELADNDCMTLALKSHVCGGGRVYAECGGMAYLCQQIEMPDGRVHPMAGVLPATARFQSDCPAPQATEVVLSSDTWLGPAGTQLRGYLNARWTIVPERSLENCIAHSAHHWDVARWHHAIGSRLHLNFAAQEKVLNSFFSAHPPSQAAAHVALLPSSREWL